jgi:glutamine synthetase
MRSVDDAAGIAPATLSDSTGPTPSDGSEFVFLGLPDVNGSIRGKAFRPEAFESALRGGTVMTDLVLALDPTDAPITDYQHFGSRSGAGDLVLRPDPGSLHALTWRPGWRICLATPYWRDGRLCELASREVYRRVLEALAAKGYEALAALEYEVRFWDAEGKPLSTGLSYSFAELHRFEAFAAALVPALIGLGIELSAIHTEAGPGLLELNLQARPGLRAADDAALTKLAVKDLAASMGLRASFLAKSAPGEEGSSGHIHLSCWKDGRNAFRAATPDGSLPPLLRSAIAGLLQHLPAASLLMNPTVNSYKRLVPGWFAPTNVSWGLENRSAAVRAIVHADRPELCRLECRRPGADANPYLALAAAVAAVTDGIIHEASPPAPIDGDAAARDDLPALPNSLDRALREFQADQRLRAALGNEFSEYYATSRNWELKAWQGTVSEWERDRYLKTV